MNPPKHGETILVMRDRAVYLALIVERVERGDHEGWYTIHGSVRHQDSAFGRPWFEHRGVYAELQEDGIVRMLSKGERISTTE